MIAVANVWTKEKGLDDILELRKLMPPQKLIVMVGMTKKQIASLPSGIVGIQRTNGRSELATLYAGADAFINPTWGDNFPTVNIEALACGTPVITYRTGGSPEAIDERTGIIVEQGDVQGLAEAVGRAARLNPADCRARALSLFNQNDIYDKYIDIYNELLLIRL